MRERRGRRRDNVLKNVLRRRGAGALRGVVRGRRLMGEPLPIWGGWRRVDDQATPVVLTGFRWLDHGGYIS